MPFSFDESRWPILLVKAIGESRDEDVDAFIAVAERGLRRGEKHVLVMDATLGQKMNLAHRKRVGDWIAANYSALQSYRAGMAFVSKSTLVRLMGTLTYKLSPPPYPVQFFDSPAEAWTWAAEALRSRGG